MATTLSIGDFSRMTYLSVRTLRRYHESGLLEPARIDPTTGYRYYTVDQLPTAQVIRRLRALDMPLDDVQRLLAAPDAATRDELVSTHLRRMEEQLERTRVAVASLRRLLGHAPAPADVQFRTEPPSRAVAISGKQALDDAAAWFRSAFEELHALVPPTRRTGPDGALYFPDFFQAEAGRLTVYVPTDASTSETGRATSLELSAAELAVMMHDGPLADLDRTYAALGAFVSQRAIGVDGPIRERFLGTSGPDHHLVEVGWPVSHAAGLRADSPQNQGEETQ